MATVVAVTHTAPHIIRRLCARDVHIIKRDAYIMYRIHARYATIRSRIRRICTGDVPVSPVGTPHRWTDLPLYRQQSLH